MRRHPAQKGAVRLLQNAEKLTDSSFEGCQFIDNGSDANKVASSNLKTWMSGVDINLKNGSYQNISFTNCTFTGNGQNNGTALPAPPLESAVPPPLPAPARP